MNKMAENEEALPDTVSLPVMHMATMTISKPKEQDNYPFSYKYVCVYKGCDEVCDNLSFESNL